MTGRGNWNGSTYCTKASSSVDIASSPGKFSFTAPRKIWEWPGDKASVTNGAAIRMQRTAEMFSTMSVVCMSKLNSSNVQITTVFTKLQQVRSGHGRLYPDRQ